jgi:hypothetical protein
MDEEKSGIEEGIEGWRIEKREGCEEKWDGGRVETKIFVFVFSRKFRANFFWGFREKSYKKLQKFVQKLSQNKFFAFVKVFAKMFFLRKFLVSLNLSRKFSN